MAGAGTVGGIWLFQGVGTGEKESLRKLPADLHHSFWIILKLESFLCQSLTFLIPVMLPPGLNNRYEQIYISQVSFMGATKWHVWDGKLLPFDLSGRHCVKSCPLWWVTEFAKGVSQFLGERERPDWCLFWTQRVSLAPFARFIREHRQKKKHEF